MLSHFLTMVVPSSARRSATMVIILKFISHHLGITITIIAMLAISSRAQ